MRLPRRLPRPVRGWPRLLGRVAALVVVAGLLLLVGTRTGRYLLRACVVNFHTSATDIDAIPAIVDETGRAIDSAARPAMLA